jgi:hydrogenase-4 component B
LNIAAIASFIGVMGPLLLWRRPLWGHWLGTLASASASMAALVAAIEVLLGAPVVRAELFTMYPFGVLSIRLDPLSAVFLGLTGVLGFAASIYGLSYARHYDGRKHLGLLAALMSSFLLALALVPLANHAVGFMLAWELMAVASFFLVAFEHESAKTRQAAVFYAVMTHLGAAFLFAAFLLFGGQTHTFDFDAWRQAAPSLPPVVTSAVFLLAFIGFGSKAGVLPLHGWLPEAHPAAPSHVSALMSGAMIKTGAYGLIRVSLDLLGGGPAWWGLVVLVVGAATALMGALYAVTESDLKRLLAFSSIENMGIILLGVGTALFFEARHQGALGALALVAALYHIINHAGFKGLMFFGAGAVQYATHTVNLERLGGLIKRMPMTAFFVLIGTLAITAMPLMNGFVSEWLTYQALFSGLLLKDVVARLALPLAASALALTGGLAFVAFIKAYAVGFLAKGRSAEADDAAEVPGTMRAGMALLAAACLALGLAPAWVIPVLNRVAEPLVGGTMPRGTVWGLVAVRPEVASLSMPAIWALLALLVPAALLVPFLLGARRERRIVKTWGCGGPLTPRTQYTAMGYAQPLRTVFGRLLTPHTQEVQVDPTVPPYFKRDMRYAVFMESIIERFLYAPTTRWVLEVAHQLTRIQGGSIHLYLAYIFFSLLTVLLLMKGLR